MLRIKEQDEEILMLKKNEGESHQQTQNKAHVMRKMEEDHNELRAREKVEIEKNKTLKQQLDRLKKENEEIQNDRTELEMKIFTYENEKMSKHVHKVDSKTIEAYDKEIDELIQENATFKNKYYEQDRERVILEEEIKTFDKEREG